MSPNLITYADAISIITDPLCLLTLAMIISTILFLKNKKSKAILLSSASLITAVIIKTLKEILKAPRPTNTLIQETGYSFPSGHTTFTVLFLGLIIYIFTKTKKQKIITSLIAIPILIVITTLRLVLKVHHPIDIVGGLIIGTIILITSILTHKKITK